MLESLGWNEFFRQEFMKASADLPGAEPARVSAEHKGYYRVRTADGEFISEVSGKMRHETSRKADLPAVGDWVAVERSGDRAVIHRLLPRKSRFSRKVVLEDIEEQVIAANIDIVFLVQGLDLNYNLSRLERYLVMAWESGAQPVIVLNKADLCADTQQRILDAEAAAPGVPVHAVSSVTREGMGALEEYLKEGVTIGFLGSSGVGKSTIINSLYGEDIQKTGEVREGDAKGRHTTTSRELFVLPGGGVVIDTPGMRELQLWDAEAGLQNAFRDIDELAEHCRFADCRHDHEPRCAVLAAVAEGRLDARRLENYRKLVREHEHLQTQKDLLARLRRKREDRKVHREMKQIAAHRKKRP